MTRRTIPTVRSGLYRWARRLGDLNAILHPEKLPRRIINKELSSKLVRRIWR